MQKTKDYLNYLGFEKGDIDLIIEEYSHPSRTYHNIDHIEEMITFVEEMCTKTRDKKKFYELILAIIGHDVIYDTSSKTNEEDSYIFIENMILAYKNKNNTLMSFLINGLPDIKRLIMATKHHNFSKNLPIEEKFIIWADLNRFNYPFSQVWKFTKDIFKEYGQHDIYDYIDGRIKFLKDYVKKIEFMGPIAVDNINKLIVALEAWEPKIGIYPGSFDPFHIGHMNIFNKAEKMFDQVIIAFGVNTEKKERRSPMPAVFMSNKRVEYYTGLLTDYVSTKKGNVTVIRGLRNTTDMQYELNQYQWLKLTKPDINVICIFSDNEFNHISSSGIRTMIDNGSDAADKYVVS